MDVRTLTGDDAETFRAALRDHPEVFGRAFEEEKGVSVAMFAARLEDYSPEAYRLGAFEGGTLLGILGFFRRPGLKVRHKAELSSMYVIPEARKQGVGKALLSEVLRRARTIVGLEELVLSVTIGNEPAKQLYLSVGFEVYCRDPRFIRVDGRDFDIEWLALTL